nr:unnamed protein product [Naegleria fowleri]
MAVKTVTASKTVQYLTGNTLSNETCQKAIELLQQDLPLPQNVPGGMSEYRRTLTLSFFYKFYVQLVKDCSLRKLTEEEESVLLSSFHKPYPIGHQYYQPKEVGTAVGKPIPHNYSHLQVTGEATYVQDIPPQSRELYAYPVLSNKPYAKIKKVDPSRALTFEGVVSWVDWRDVKGSNRVGAVIHDEEELFLTTETTAVGQLIGFILAETHLKAMVAAKAVHVEYEENENPILSIDDALQKGAPVLIERKMFRGDSVAKFEELSNNEDIEIIEGDIKIGGQEHFYFETQSCLILPGKYGLSGDEGEVVVFSSTQSPSHTQSMVASVLGIPDNKVITKLKRLGGGFGGKESRSCILAAAAAVAAKKVNRPVRCILDRDIDMAHTGQRHPCYAKYKIAINKKTLKFEAIHTDIYLNGGYSLDFSKGVLERALYSFDNVYYMPHVTVIGKAFKTNLPTNTAFRGFGGPQGLMVCETIVEHVSHALSVKYPQLNSDKSQLCNDIRQINMYTEHNAITPYKQLIGDVHRIRLMWERIHEITNYPQRLKQVNEYNKKHKYQKRGISLIPTKFAISFGVTFLNQATALVNIYSHDGSVYISHAGCEMGQGVHIKVAQCAATSLGIPLDLIHVGETSTDKAPNTSATAASVGSDLNGFATKNACEKINENLSKLKKELFPELYMEHNLNDLNYVPILTHDQWRKLVKTAYLNCIPLSSTGFYKTPNLCMDWDKCEGTPFSYFTYGVACSEVQIDTLTGDWSVLRTDIVMDVGDSLNPTIDIGQIEGAFIQGMGYYTMEELIFGDSAHPWVQAGHLFTKGPGNYKIPSGNDLPDEFNVHLLRDDMERPFPSSVYSSKGIGEPPLFLASSVLFAIRHAIFDLRKQMGLNDYFVLDSPATTERIRMLCSDQFTNYFNKEQCFRAKGSF